MNKRNTSPLDRLIAELGKLPGVGTKTATRLAFNLLGRPQPEVLALAQAIVDVKEQVKRCSVCSNIDGTDPCSICADPKRRTDVICVVEQPADLVAIERTGEYRGLYHVLGGVLSAIEGIGPEDLSIQALQKRLAAAPVREVIVATNPTVDGETTAHYLADLLQRRGLKFSRIAQGLPVGSNLEYADRVTMARSLANRRDIE